jgi:pimeloyl-ACP methyl ester carboxylesterase/DNA-binding CsgD family transcriptional regulator
METNTKYVKSGDVYIAYQVVGTSPLDLVYIPGWISHVEYNWQNPLYAHYLNRLASFSRLIVFDKRGTGLSDRIQELPTLEQRMDDIRAVMDAVGSKRAVIMGASEGGNTATLFAATYPERTTALIICGSFAKRVWSPEYPWAPTPEQRQKYYDQIVQEWGDPIDLDGLAPSMSKDEEFRRWWAAYLRHSASPGTALALTQTNTQTDTTYVLPNIHVPTLVLHRTGDRDVNVDEGRYIANHIPGAKFVELPGTDHFPFTENADALLDQIESFLITLKQMPPSSRILATILVLRASVDMGFARQELTLIRQTIVPFRGVEVACDERQIVAAFDGPSRAIRCAIAIREQLVARQRPLQAGLHTGECEVRANTWSGPALLAASKIAEKAATNEILVSTTVKDLVSGSGLEFRALGSAANVEAAVSWSLFAVTTEDKPRLTRRELDVVRLIAQGLTNEAIADRLALSEHTVHRHVANIYNKLDVSSRAAAVAYCLRHTLL